MRCGPQIALVSLCLLCVVREAGAIVPVARPSPPPVATTGTPSQADARLDDALRRFDDANRRLDAILARARSEEPRRAAAVGQTVTSIRRVIVNSRRPIARLVATVRRTRDAAIRVQLAEQVDRMAAMLNERIDQMLSALESTRSGPPP